MKITIYNQGGEKIYSADLEDNTVAETVEKAVKDDVLLRDADLRNADLRNADLCNANLCNANLRGANLRGANLYSADLRDANLCNANLSGAKLSDANLCDANLRGADLRGADLSDANLRDANLSGANLCNANLYSAKNIPFIPLACPSDGAFTGWKKVGEYLIQLEIPADARRSSATNTKCRCDKALVVAITDLDNGEFVTTAYSDKYKPITYKVGEMVIPDSFDEDRWNECSHGIHFFINKQEAINY